MTEIEVFEHFAQKIVDAIPDEINNWDKAILYIDRIDGYMSSKAILKTNFNEISLDELDAGFYTARYVHFLFNNMVSNGQNPWNKLEFTLFSDFKSNVKFIWDQELQDELDGKNN